MKEFMNVIIKETEGEGLTLSKKPIPEISDNEVLIKVIAASICGTDKHIYEWDEWSQNRIKPPVTVGHELAGEIVMLGKNVVTLNVGDIVSVETHIVCGECEQCRTGNGHICQNTEIIGVDVDGAFAEYIKMPASNCMVNKTKIDPKYISILEPLGNAVHTLTHFDIVGKNVAIVGCGPIGLMAVNVAKALGAKKVIAVEVDEYRIQMAKDLGADVIINPVKEDVIKRMFIETENGVDVVAEFSGNKNAIEAAFKYVKLGGKMSLLGIPSKNIEIDLAKDVVFKGIEIYGVVGRLMYDTWYKVVGLVESGVLDLDKIVTHEFALEDFEEGFKLMKEGKCGKIVLFPGGINE
ncbi:L-threonine 3-dehydrogenase [Mycoplasmatota bacterium]|nr:L-threonine 3-dehydrogenase [Mycoplasmatota bacterium]